MRVYDDLDGEKYKTEANQKDADRIREDLRDIAKRTELIGQVLNRIVSPKTKGNTADEDRQPLGPPYMPGVVGKYRATDKDTGISLEVWQMANGCVYQQVQGGEIGGLGLMSRQMQYELKTIAEQKLNSYLASLCKLGTDKPAVECELCHDECGSEKCIRPAHQPKANPTQDTGWKHMANLWQAKANVFECRVKELTAQLEDKDKTINALKSTLKGVERALLR